MTALTADNQAWQLLKRHTPARIGLARVGAHIATAEQLAFQLAHAKARDAVYTPYDPAAMIAALEARGMAAIALNSAATDRNTYLTRPDLGRHLAPRSREDLVSHKQVYDISFALTDGLSAQAIHRHALPMIDAVMPALVGWRTGPVAVVTRGRVAIGDEIGEILAAKMAVVMIGERPGLSSPDSLGIYVTWAPRQGCTDAMRNCISNVRPEGLCYADAAAQLIFLMTEARRRQLTGIMLKDETALGHFPEKRLGRGDAPSGVQPSLPDRRA